METRNDAEEKVEQGGALKTSANFLIIIAVAITVLFFLEKAGRINLISGTIESTDPVQTEEYFADLQEKYKNDTYGGSTPGETLKLFITALKAGDTELASKYFIIEKQEEWRVALDNSKKAGNLTAYTTLVEKASAKKYGKEIYNGTYQINYPFQEGQPDWEINLVLNSQTSVWKLESM